VTQSGEAIYVELDRENTSVYMPDDKTRYRLRLRFDGYNFYVMELIKNDMQMTNGVVYYILKFEGYGR